MSSCAFRSPAKQRERDQLAGILRVAHARDPKLGRALGRLRRAWERRRVDQEEKELALMDRCWWRREERAEALREASRENFSARHGAGRNQALNQ
jgi:hypothetical protein